MPVSSMRTMPFDLVQFGVGVLQLGGALDQHVDAGSRLRIAIS